MHFVEARSLLTKWNEIPKKKGDEIMEKYLGEKTPKLGFGLMRLPQQQGKPDIEQIKVMVDQFMGAGFTYFDTAYVYGESERTIRKALVERYPRDSYTMATKMNAWLGSPSLEETKEQFEKSLANTGLEYFDYYLLHAVQENNYRVYDDYGLWDYVKDLKEKGLVRNWGFSFHAGPELLDRLLTEHPDVDFIQLQVNYADMDDPKIQARDNINIARKHKIPFTVMEPVKGGMLANPPESIKRIFDEADKDASYASWAIRYAASMDGVITVLSGMSNTEQMENNISYMREFKPLNESEQETIRKVQKALNEIESIRCTGCHYCVEGCPMKISIPDVFTQMNRYMIYNDLSQAKRYYEFYHLNASDCIQCGQCEGACPQGLPIIEHLQNAVKILEE